MGYEAIISRPGIWSDLQHETIPIYITQIITPFDLDVPEEDVCTAIHGDFGPLYPGDDLQPISHAEADRRAFKKVKGTQEYQYNVFSCQLIQHWKDKNWKDNRYEIIIRSHKPFNGFVLD